MVSTELTFDGEPTVWGSGWVTEYEAAGSTTCSQGFVLHFRNSGGLGPPDLAFADRTAGTSATSTLETPLTWHPSNQDAQADERTRQWAGTWEVTAWTADHVALALTAGEWCDHPDYDRATCEPSPAGTLVIDGLRDGPETAAGVDGGFVDGATGDPICGANLQ